MTPEPPAPPENPPPDGGVQIDDVAGNLTIAGDVAGRDVVRNVTNVGLGFKEVQRLLIVVGVLVFATAACFFSGGVVVGGVALAAMNKPVGSTPEAGQAFASKLETLTSLPPGQPFVLQLSEVEISSYVKYFVGEQMGLRSETGKVRLLPNGQLLLSGDVNALGGLPVTAIFNVQTGADQTPLVLSQAMVRPIGSGVSPFGWVWVPTSIVQPLASNAVDLLTSHFSIISVADMSSGADVQWAVSGITR